MSLALFPKFNFYFIDQLKSKQKKSIKRKANKNFYEEADATTYDENITFQEMNLSRPLLKVRYFTIVFILRIPFQAINALNFVYPTPIQARCVPVALLGKDICACAATGTGKSS